MVRVTLESLMMGPLPTSAVMVLRPTEAGSDHDVILPIMIGPFEAACIGGALRREPSPRPLTHSLLASVIVQLGGTLDRVVIEKVSKKVFYATVHIRHGLEVTKLDARPSDAVALAVRMDAPIFVKEEVLWSASYPSWLNAPQAQRAAEVEEFGKFLETLDPDDFILDERGDRSMGNDSNQG